MNSLVSVCISTYNRKELLMDALNSVLRQTYNNLEIIIVDDCSTDGTESIMKEFPDNRVKYLKHKENKGLAAARNTAIFAAKGTFFTFLDDDDIWEEDFVESFVKLAGQYNENWCFCCGNKSSNGNCIVPKFENNLKDIIYLGYTPPVSAQFYYNETLKSIGGYNEDVKSGVDHDLWIKLAIHNVKIKSLDRCLSLANSGLFHERMTTNYQKRINGVERSLRIWEGLIVQHFGNKFFQHFVTDYYNYLYVNFLMYSLKQYDIKEFIKIILKCKNIISLCFYIIRRVYLSKIKEISNNPKTMQPLFTPFREG